MATAVAILLEVDRVADPASGLGSVSRNLASRLKDAQQENASDPFLRCRIRHRHAPSI